MRIRAVIFDIGGVLEVTPRTGWVARWEKHLQLQPGDLHARLTDVWADGKVGRITIMEVEQRIGAILGLDPGQRAALLRDLWDEYCGTLNIELAVYFARLRPRYQTALLSNSFIGAREEEHARYQFGNICDMIIYSHEEGMEKPDPRFFALTWTRLGIQPDEIVFLDDVEVYVAAARKLGIHAILFQNTAQAIAEIEVCLNEGEEGEATMVDLAL